MRGVEPLTWVNRVFSVSEQQDQQETAEVEQVNTELTRALKLCHSLVDDYRAKLASKLDGPSDFLPANDDESGVEARLGL